MYIYCSLKNFYLRLFHYKEIHVKKIPWLAKAYKIICNEVFTIIAKTIQKYLSSLVISNSFWFPTASATVAKVTGYYSSHSSSNH